MLDFIFRRGNPTNGWRRAAELSLAATLDEPTLMGVRLGSRFDRLSSLGRSDDTQFGTLCYFDLGVGIDHDAEKDAFSGFTIVLADVDGKFQPYRGAVSWKGERLPADQLTQKDLPNVLGDWYWLDADEDESIAFYEYRGYEMQIEMALSGGINRFIITANPLMADPEQRESYNVDKPWPPEFKPP